MTTTWESVPSIGFSTEESGVLDLPCLDVPTLMASHNMDHLTILHCDIQGAEFTMLQRAADLLREKRVDWVFVSTHHHSISGDPLTHQRCLFPARDWCAH